MKLYHSSGSPNSRRVRILIAEKGLDIELSPVDLGAKEQFSDAYRAINPRAVVPTLVLDDGTAIGEVPAIMRYLDEAYPKVPLLGATPKEKALITMWERRAELEGFAPVMEGVRNAAAGLKGHAIAGPDGYEQIPALIERSKQRVANFYTSFEARLKDVEFVAGDGFSAADITTLVTVDFDLTLGEYNIVHLLVSNAGKFVTYRAVYDRLRHEGFIAGYGADGYRANVRSAIKRIRNKFRALDPTFDKIENYTGFGYCWRKPS